MTLPARKEEHKYTYAEYIAWTGDDRWEIIDGVAFDMAPPPTEPHVAISTALAAQFYNHLEGKPCRVYMELGVRLPDTGESDLETTTVVIPDISIVCDRKKLDILGCKGAPDLIVEILSPTTREIDLTIKLKRYEHAGVREYWIIDPDRQSLTVYLLGENGKYQAGVIYTREAMAPVYILHDITIDLQRVFRVLLEE